MKHLRHAFAVFLVRALPRWLSLFAHGYEVVDYSGSLAPSVFCKSSSEVKSASHGAMSEGIERARRVVATCEVALY